MPVSQPQKVHHRRPNTAMLIPKVQAPAQERETIKPPGAAPVNISLKTSEELKQEQDLYQMVQESQHLVRELIRAAIGCITYLRYFPYDKMSLAYCTAYGKAYLTLIQRGLIPETSFEDVVYGTSSDRPSPNGSKSISQDPSEGKKREPGTRVKHVLRGNSSEGDTLVDWMEKGIFYAMERGYLKAFQLAVFLDPSTPEIIQEAYTFTINYSHGPNHGVVDGITMSDIIQNGEKRPLVPELLDAHSVRRSARAIIRRLIVVTQNLDLLPEDRYLTIRLYHTSDTPEGWAPPTFTVSTGTPFLFLQSSKDPLTDEIFGVMDTSMHSYRSQFPFRDEDIQVRVTSAKRSASDSSSIDDLGDLDDTPRKKNRIGAAIAAEEFVHFASAQAPSGLAPEPAHEKGHSRKTVLPGDHVGLPGHENYKSTTPIYLENNSQTPSRRGNGASSWGGSKLESHPPTSSRNSSCSLEIVSRLSEAPISNPSSSLSLNLAQKAEQSLSIPATPSSKMNLAGKTLVELQTAMHQNPSPRGHDSGDENSSQISCECGNYIDSPHSDFQIQCDICHKWQHCECYGFDGPNDPRIGDVHACYTCLLGRNEAHLLENMKFFAIARRVVRYLERSKVARTLHDMTKTLKYPQDTTSNILTMLVTKAYIQRINPRGTATKKTPDKFKLLADHSTRKSLEENVLDPLINISHHYAASGTALKTDIVQRSQQDNQSLLEHSEFSPRTSLGSQNSEDNPRVSKGAIALEHPSSFEGTVEPLIDLQEASLRRNVTPSQEAQATRDESGRRGRVNTKRGAAGKSKFRTSDPTGLLKAGDWS
ncbi:hypothetical protein ABW19_dt0202435 [Dactylella cylindrospora]|nr:hypothetical protein ABW19_dt0202435 [Dactylella cylindrospora]